VWLMSTGSPSLTSVVQAAAPDVAVLARIRSPDGVEEEGFIEADLDDQSDRSIARRANANPTAAAASIHCVLLQPTVPNARLLAPIAYIRRALRSFPRARVFPQPKVNQSRTRPVSLPIAPSQVHIREITESNKDAVALLLATEFPRSKRTVWLEVFEKLAKHQAPAGLPQYGYFMENEEGAAVGAILMISSIVRTGNVRTIRCNLSSWCVAPAYRCLAYSFITRILKKNTLTYVNISPAPHTLPLIQMQGFSHYCTGQFCALAIPFTFSRNEQVEIVSTGVRPNSHFEEFEYDLLQTHAKGGCISLWCVTPDRAHPFVFRPRLLGGFVPYVQLIYCRSIDEFVLFAKPIGRFLARRGRLFVMMDSNGRIRDLIGVYREGWLPKFFRGPTRPRLGDLAYTELGLFGM